MQLFSRLFAMRHRLYVRIYLAILFSLAIAAGISSWVANTYFSQVHQGVNTIAEIAAQVLPPVSAPDFEQRAALRRWQGQVRADMSLFAPSGRPLAHVGPPILAPEKNLKESGWIRSHPPIFALKLPDERWLLIRPHRPSGQPVIGLLMALVIVALVVGIAAFPIVRRITRRLELLQSSVDALGQGKLSTRVPVSGEDEVGKLALSFNRSAEKIEQLILAQKNLLANASHELRSPLARLKMALALLPDQPPLPPPLQNELQGNIRELDELIEEILLASQLEAQIADPLLSHDIDLQSIAEEEAAHIGASALTEACEIKGDLRLIRRLIRNLLENAKRYGVPQGMSIHEAITLKLFSTQQRIVLQVCDRGPGIPEEYREAIFQAFFRLPGASERAGGVGLGLSLVRQIAQRHGAQIQYRDRDDGGGCFEVSFPDYNEVQHFGAN